MHLSGLQADGLQNRQNLGVFVRVLDAFVDECLDAVLAHLDLGEGGLGLIEFSGKEHVLEGQPGDAEGEQGEQKGRPQQEQVGLHELRFIGSNDEAKREGRFWRGDRLGTAEIEVRLKGP